MWLIGAMVRLLAAPLVQLSISAGNGWPHNALRHHWLMPVSCHFRDWKSAAGQKSDSCKLRYNKCPDLYLLPLKGKKAQNLDQGLTNNQIPIPRTGHDLTITCLAATSCRKDKDTKLTVRALPWASWQLPSHCEWYQLHGGDEKWGETEEKRHSLLSVSGFWKLKMVWHFYFQVSGRYYMSFFSIDA